MQERDLWWKIVIIAVLSAMAFAAVYPLESKIKLGIDLAGGYSLLYEIDDTGLEGEDRENLSQNIMTVLQRRVDPKGVFNLVWRPVGHNRLEIQMPTPSQEVKAARQEFEHAQEKLRATVIRRSNILAALLKPQEARAAEFVKLAGSDPSRIPLLEQAAAAYAELDAARSAYEKRRSEIADAALTQEQIMAALELPADARQGALDALVGPIPARKDLLDRAAEAYDAWKAADAAAASADPAASQPEASSPAFRKAELELAVRRVVEANIDPAGELGGVSVDTVVALEDKFDDAVARVLATNVDLRRLQVYLDMERGDPAREKGIEEIKKENPGVSDLINSLVDANTVLDKRRRGSEGRLEDPADLQRLLRGAGVLEFRILPLNSNDASFDEQRSNLAKFGPLPRPNEDRYQWFEIEDPADFLNTKLEALATDFDTRKQGMRYVVDRFGDRYFVLAHIGEGYSMTHARKGQRDWSLKSSYLTRDENGRPAIGFTIDQMGGMKFGALTGKHVQEPLAIFLDDKAISAANINSRITTQGIIQGNFTVQEVQDMVKKLNAGSLPQKLKDPPISIRAIGPSLGKANIDAGKRSALWGAVAVVTFMLVIYRYAGFVALIAMVINMLFTLAMMAALGATLTLPGLAGLVLAMAMAVDANVLINERIREELERGTALRMAIRLGYERAFSAILDSNLTTILTSIILYFVGSEAVKGFGFTLGVGVFINIFTAYFITRIFFEYMGMISIPREVNRYPIIAAAAIAGTGAVMYGLGYAFNDPAELATSSLVGFGRALLESGAAVLVVLLMMFLLRKLHANRKSIPMTKLIGVPTIDWIGKRKVYFAVSGAVALAGLAAFFTLERDDIYDIEFLGGVSAQIDLNAQGEIAEMPRDDQRQTAILERLDEAGDRIAKYGDAISEASFTRQDGVYRIESEQVRAATLEPFLRAVLGDQLSPTRAFDYEDPKAKTILLYPAEGRTIDLDRLKTDLVARFRSAAESIRNAQVQSNTAFEDQSRKGRSYTVVTREASKDIVVLALLETLENELDMKPRLSFNLQTNAELGGVPYFPIRDVNPRSLGVPMSDTEAAAIDLQGWQGGVAMVLEEIDPPQQLEELQSRLRAMRLQPGFEKYGWRESNVFSLASDERGRTTKAMVVTTDENYPIESEQGGLSPMWQSSVAEPEVELLRAALTRQQSLAQITQFDTQVSEESQVQAYLALVLSWIMIIVFVWFRFGNVRWGLAAVVALIHDIVIAMGFVAATYYISRYTPFLGDILLIDKTFRIDLAMIAAILTVVGYSVNDKIVIFDRIRENRGRLTDISPQIVNDSISQTLSRTLLTGLTTIVTILIMYTIGGDGIHGFNFVLLIGIVMGTYSSFGIASQLLVRRSQIALAKA